MGEVAEDFHLTLEIDMEAEVTHDKAAVVASSKRLASAIARIGTGLSQKDCEPPYRLALTSPSARPGGAGPEAQRALHERLWSKGG